MIKKKLIKKKGKKRPIKKKLIRRYNTGGMYQPALPSSMMPIQNIVYEQTDPNYLDQYEQGLDATAEASRNWRQEALQRNQAMDQQTNQLAGQLTKLGQLDQVQQFGNKATDFVKDLFSKKAPTAPTSPLSMGDLQSMTGGAPVGPSLANPTAGMDLGLDLSSQLPGGGAPAGLNLQTTNVQDYVSKGLQDNITGGASNLTSTAAESGKSFLGTGKEFAQTKVGGSLTSALKNPMLYTMGAQLIGGAISRAADDNDVTTFTGKEKAGRMLSSAGQWASVGSALGPLGTIVGGIGGAIHGAASGKKMARIARRQQAERKKARGRALQDYAMASGRMKEYSGYDLGMGYARMGGKRLYRKGGQDKGLEKLIYDQYGKPITATTGYTDSQKKAFHADVGKSYVGAIGSVLDWQDRKNIRKEILSGEKEFIGGSLDNTLDYYARQQGHTWDPILYSVEESKRETDRWEQKELKEHKEWQKNAPKFSIPNLLFGDSPSYIDIDADGKPKKRKEMIPKSVKERSKTYFKLGGPDEKPVEGKQGLLYNALPLNARTLLESISGVESDITEDDLTGRQKRKLQEVVRKNLSEGKNIIEYTDYDNLGTKDLEWSQTDKSDTTADIVKKSLSDPGYNLKTTLGQSRIQIIPREDGSAKMDTLVTDTYDFNNAKKVQQDMESNKMTKKEKFNQILKDDEKSVFGKLREMAAAFGPKEGEGRDVKINISDDARYGGLRNMYKGGGFDFNVNQERQRIKDYDAPGGTADKYQKMATQPWSEQLDDIQTGLTVAGMSPIIGAGADLANTVISGGRTLTNLVTGNFDNAKKHALNTGVNALTTVPILGQGVAGGKLVNTVMKTSGKQLDNLMDAKNLRQGTKAATTNIVDPFVKASKGDPLYQAKALGKTIKTEKLASPVENKNLISPMPTPGPVGFPLITTPQPGVAGPMPRQFGRMGGKRLEGGIAKPLPGGATKFIGRSHEQGGIMVDPMTEVEGGETMDKVNFGKGGKKDYFFSSYLKLGGRSFADRHEAMVKSGASQTEIDALADMQEKTAGRKKMRLGGKRKLYKRGGYPFYNNDINSPDTPFYTTSHNPDGERGDSVIYYYYDPNDVNAEKTFTSEAAMKEHMKGSGTSAYFPNTANNLGDSASYNFPVQDTPSDDPGSGTSEEELKFQQQTGIDPSNPDYFYFLRQWQQGEYEGEIDDGSQDDSPEDNPGENKPGAAWDGLYNNLKMGDVEPYLEEIRQLTGLEDFDFKNPDHVKKLQTRLTGDPDDAGLITGEEGEYIGKEGKKSVNFAGIDGKFGTDTFEALKLMLDNQKDDEPTDDEPTDDTPKEDDKKIDLTTDTEDDVDVNMDFKKPFPWHKVAAGVGMGIQMLPAIAAMRSKPDYMAAPGEVPKTHLDRVRFDDARAANQRELRGMGRFIEQSGLGPGGIAAKMAAYEKSNQQEAKIGAMEKRQNAAIANQEAGMNQKAAMQNIKNRMYVNEFNTGARAATKDRKLSGLDTMAKNVAGMTKDLLAYKSQQDLARAVAGNTGVNERFWEIEAAFRKANPNLSPGTEDYNNALTQYTTYHTNQSQQLVNNVENQTDNQDADNARYGGYKRNRKKLKRKKQIYG